MTEIEKYCGCYISYMDNIEVGFKNGVTPTRPKSTVCNVQILCENITCVIFVSDIELSLQNR